MKINSRAEAFNVNNVTSFRGYDVENGEVTLSDSEYVSILNDENESIDVLGSLFRAGDLLLEMDETSFNQMKSDHETTLQTELEDALFRERESDIEFEVEPDSIGTYHEGEDARQDGEEFDDEQSDEWKEGWNDKDEEMKEE